MSHIVPEIVSSTATNDAIPQARTEEPPAGVQGKGTMNEPYDQGNAPEVAAGPGIEPPSGVQGKGTVDSAYDQGNEPENAESTTSNPVVQATSPPPSTGPDTTTSDAKPDQTPVAQSKDASETRGRSKMLEPPNSKNAGTSDEAARLQRFERSVSPGQLADGTHVRCSGDKGEGYTPGGKMEKLKERFHFGKRH